SSISQIELLSRISGSSGLVGKNSSCSGERPPDRSIAIVAMLVSHDSRSVAPPSALVRRGQPSWAQRQAAEAKLRSSDQKRVRHVVAVAHTALHARVGAGIGNDVHAR